MEIKGFIESSLNEWEGQIASVIFLPYCNLRCRYCHAAHLIIHPERLETVPTEQILRYLERQIGWIDGVAITGGEPTLHEDELLALIERIKAVPLKVMIETNGTRPAWVGRLLCGGFVDAISMDVKAPLTREDYERVTGKRIEPELVRSSIRQIVESGVPHEFRITVVPGLIDRRELERMAPELRGAEKIAIQNFQPDHCLDQALRNVTSYLPHELDDLEEVFAGIAGRCVVRGRERAVASQGAA